MMELASTDDGERGQVGIGTLIIFIAMVLVAAVAAGVLINTAGLLESTASDTSADSQAQVSNQIAIVSAVGEVDSNDNVTELDFTLMQSAGSGDISLQNATVHYQSESASETLSYGTNAGANTFVLEDTSGSVLNYNNDDDTTLSETDERIVLTLDLSAIGDPLPQGSSATVRFVDQSGATTIYGVNVPSTISNENYVAV
jgi:flagellin-like protein